MTPSEHAGLSRILHRLCRERGGTAVPDEDGWRIDVPAPEDQPGVEGYAFLQRVEGSVLSNDARVDLVNIDTARALAEFQRDLAEAIQRERTTFASLEQIYEFLADYGGYEVEDCSDAGYLVVEVDEDWATTITLPEARDELWIELAMTFHDADADWLLAANGRLIGMAFEIAGESVGLRTTVPLSTITGQRLLEMLEDLASRHGILGVEHEMDDEEDEDEAGDEQWTEATAIVGPWPDAEACRRAFDNELVELEYTPLPGEQEGSSMARAYEIAGTHWIAGPSHLIARLAYELEGAQPFGVEPAHDDEGHVVEVWLWKLDRGAEGQLIKAEDLGEEPETRDPEAAVLDWEPRLAARAVGAAETVSAPRQWWYLADEES